VRAAARDRLSFRESRAGGGKAIAGALRGAPIDTSRDYDFTNWSEVDAFTHAFLAFALELTPQAAVA
jgi:hypothetical protein